MEKLAGVSVSAGIAVGKAMIIDRPKLVIKRRKIDESAIDEEKEKFETSVRAIYNELENLIEITQNRDNRDILKTQKIILKDPEFIASINKMITKKLYTVEYAIKKHFSSVIEIFNNLENEYFTERSTDYEDVAYRLLSHILDLKQDRYDQLEEDSILITINITPSEVTRVFEKNIKGICLEQGSKNSHSSIIARSMNLPTLVNVHGLTEKIRNGNKVIIDGNKGRLIINPDKETLEKYIPLLEKEIRKKEELLTLIDKECITRDGRKISLQSNIEIPEELDQVLKFKSKGIGLFRTEFLFIDRKDLPGEDEQCEIYRKISEALKPESVVIRTIDVGGDKLSQLLNIEHEFNPNLGTRGIRISLKHIPVFKTQIKAILRASLNKNIKMMFPMISTVGEIITIKEIIAECKSELDQAKIGYDKDIEIGAMIEIPSAAITSDTIAEECDFLSIGTNDLVQYTLAVDRDNESIESYYVPYHPSVLRLLRLTVENGHKKNRSVSICGEMASEKTYIPLLIGLGIDEFSVSPGRLLMVKNEIINCSYEKAKKIAEEALSKKTYLDVFNIINQEEDC